MGYALRLGTGPEEWKGVALIFRPGLTLNELPALAVSALRSLEPSDAAQVFEFTCPSAGYPLLALDNVMHEAKWWTGLTDESYSDVLRRAVLLAKEKLEPCNVILKPDTKWL